MKTPFYILAVYSNRFVAALCNTVEQGKTFAENHPNASDLVQVRTHEDLKSVDTPTILRLVNFVKPDGTEPTKRFSDRQKAMKSGYTAMTKLLAGTSAPTESAPTISPTEDTEMAKKEKAAPVEEQTSNAELTAEQTARLETLKADEAAIRANMTEAEKSYKAFMSKSREDLNVIRKERSEISKKPRKGGVKRTEAGETETVTKILDLLRRDEGATKKQLIEGVPQAKPAYISALLTGILAKKGYILEGQTVEGQKGKTYRITGRKPVAVAE